jgi:hypothetical protein
MTELSRFLLRIARWIAGPQRREWVDAMEAESAAAGAKSMAWAFGCLWASMRERLWREWRFLVAVPLIGFGPLLLSSVLLFPMAWLWHHGWIPKWLIDHSALFEMLPFAILLGRIRPARTAYMAATICFAVGVMIPLAIGWLAAGESPLVAFGPYSTWYMFSPAVGLIVALLVWLAGAWLGSKWRPHTSHTPVTD